MRSLRWKLAQYFEKRWWKKYLVDKNPEEYHTWKRNYWMRFLEDISQWVIPSPAQVSLDMGCGPAGIFMVLPGKVTAVDPLLETYKAQLPHFKVEKYPNVYFCTSRAEDFTPTETFDHVFSLNVINHVTDITKTIQILNACCKTGGKLVISIDVHKYSFLRTVFRIFQFDILHPFQFTLKEYRNLIENEGLKILGDKILRKGLIFDYFVIIAEK